MNIDIFAFSLGAAAGFVLCSVLLLYFYLNAKNKLQRLELRLITEKSAAINEADLARLRLEEIQTRLNDWEQAKEETLTHTKAALMEVSGQISKDLIDHHQRETQAAKKDSEERISKTTQDLFKQMEKVTTTVATLDDNVKKSGKIADTVWRALTSPQGAGYYGEIGLENTLRSFGLEPERDFIMQYSITGGKLRPDALVLLPHGNLLVIDAKASKHLMDIAENEASAEEESKIQNFLKTMNTHLKTLSGRDYEQAIRAELKESGKAEHQAEVINVMYLPSESAVARLAKADPEFRLKAFKQGIIIAGPESLACIVAISQIKIQSHRQIENYERIMDSVQKLIEAVANAIKFADDVGKGIEKAAKSFANFASSVNSRLLPRTRQLTKLGVGISSAKAIPSNLQAYQVISANIEQIEAYESEPERLEDAV